MIRILFVCLGNICRSPMAEYVMRRMVEKKGLAARFTIESAATSSYEVGNPIYPPAYRKLQQHGIDASPHRSRQIRSEDYGKYDMIIGMDESNMRNMHRAFGGDPESKLTLLLQHCGRNDDVADPWYTGDFDATWRDVNEGCRAILNALKEQHNW